MKLVGDDVVRLITSEDDRAVAQLTELVDPRLGGAHVSMLQEAIAALRISEVQVDDMRVLAFEEVAELAAEAPPGAVAEVAVAAVVSRSGIAADVFITTTASGALSGMRVRVDPPPIADADALREALWRLDPDASVVVRSPTTASDDGRVKAVASLAKIFILLATLEAVACGHLGLEDQHEIQAGDISPLSAGLDLRHVGVPVTIADLCRLMILRSDNSAGDILLRAVGPGAVARTMELCGVDPTLNRPLRSMRETVAAAWGAGPAEVLRRAAAVTPVHHRGLDYYARLDSVAEAFNRLSRFAWTPWSDVPAPPFYKGGAAPGVLAAAWVLPTGADHRAVLLAVNSDVPLGAVEELYAFACAESLLERLGIRLAAGGGTPYVASKEG